MVHERLLAAAALLAGGTVSEGPAPPRAWGFNYDHFAPVPGSGHDCLMNLDDLLALPDTPQLRAAVATHLR